MQPESAEAQHYLGVALEKQSDIEGASAAFRKALELNPSDAYARQRLAKLRRHLWKADDPTKIAEFEEYIRAVPIQRGRAPANRIRLGASEVLMGLVSLWATASSHSRSLANRFKALSKSLQLDIRNAEAHKILGRDLMMIGRFDAAQVEFEQGIRYNPQSAEIHYDLGKLFSMQDNWEDARKEFEEALRIEPTYIEALDALGLATEASGRRCQCRREL